MPRIFRKLNYEPKNFLIATTVRWLRFARRRAMRQGRTIGFVPTMGALHEGHLALIRQAARENHEVYVSIYLNPTQFGVNEDLSSYPRTWPADKSKLDELNVEFEDKGSKARITTVFMPSTKEMYPGSPPTSEIDGAGSFVTITPLSTRLEGASRPVFFRGVATVCMKLLNIVQPERVYFGQKDIQQTFVVKRMVQDFHLNTEVRVGPTVRDKDGLAMSSRNVYLGARRRVVALALLNSFKEVQAVFARGARKRKYLYNAAIDKLECIRKQQLALPREERARFDIDYISIADPDTLDELEEVSSEKGAILSGAIKMLPTEAPQEGEDTGQDGGTMVVRLIDNIRLDLLSSKVGYIPELATD
jgi:pantoate--beta-alanine ligase